MVSVAVEASFPVGAVKVGEPGREVHGVDGRQDGGKHGQQRQHHQGAGQAGQRERSSAGGGGGGGGGRATSVG